MFNLVFISYRINDKIVLQTKVQYTTNVMVVLPKTLNAMRNRLFAITACLKETALKMENVGWIKRATYISANVTKAISCLVLDV